MFYKFVVFLACLKVVLSFPDGAPTAACETLSPLHNVAPRPEQMPMETVLESNVVHPGELTSISFRILNDTWMGPITFRGFIVQARIMDSNLDVTGRVVGTFELTDGVRHVVCPTLPVNSVVTHSVNSDRTFLTLLWRAPNIFEDSLTVNFYYTIVMNGSFFWENGVSLPLIIENPARSSNP